MTDSSGLSTLFLLHILYIHLMSLTTPDILHCSIFNTALVMTCSQKTVCFAQWQYRTASFFFYFSFAGRDPLPTGPVTSLRQVATNMWQDDDDKSAVANQQAEWIKSTAYSITRHVPPS